MCSQDSSEGKLSLEGKDVCKQFHAVGMAPRAPSHDAALSCLKPFQCMLNAGHSIMQVASVDINLMFGLD